MITEERVWSVLIESNPVPDVDVFDSTDTDTAADLAILEQRRSEVTQLDERTKPHSRGRSTLLWLAAAALVVLLGALVIFNQSGGDETPAVTSPTVPPPTQPLVDPKVSAVLEAIAAFNSGDGEAFRATFDPSAEEVAEPWEWEGGVFHTHDVMMAANEQLTVVGDCAVSADDDAVVECLIGETNDWHGKAGITHDVETQFRLNGSNLITSWTFDYGCCADEFAFNRAFYIWMNDTHRDVWDEIRPGDPESFPGYTRDPAHMATAITYVDEFLDQSTDYPVDLHKQVVGGEGD